MSASRVLMLVINPMTSDTRVEKQASSLTAAGHDVTVVATWADGLPTEEARDGYRIIRRPYRRVVKDAVVAPSVRASARARADARLRALHRVPTLRLRLRTGTTVLRRVGARLWLYGGGAILKVLRTRLLPVEYWLGIARHLRDLPRPDVICAHDLGPLRSAVRLARSWTQDGRSPAVVYDSHELYTEQQTSWTARERMAWKLHERRNIRVADLIVTVSEGIAVELEDRYGLRSRPLVALNSPPFAAVARDTSGGVRRDAGVGEGLLAVYVGAVKPGRGVDRLVDALAQRSGWDLAVVGASVDDAHVVALADQARQLGVFERLHVLRGVPAATLPTYISSADVGVHAMEPTCRNHELALPNKLFDYLFAGLPVAVSRLQEMERLVTTEQLGTVFDPDDPFDIADAIVQAASGRRFAISPSLLTELSWDRQAERLVAAYEVLASGDRSR